MKELARTLGLRDLTLLVIGTVIGSGIFLVPGGVLRQANGNVAAAMLLWALGGVLSVLGALTYGELGALKPEAGGLYVYVRDAFGRLWAFLYGWALFFLIGTGSVATLAAAFASYVRQLAPLSPTGGTLAGLAMIMAVAWVNIRGTRLSLSAQNVTTTLKVGALLALGLLFFSPAPPAALPPAVSQPPTLLGLAAGLVAVLWAYEGWQYVTFAAGEVRDPERSFPAGIVAGTLAVVAVYLLANAAYVARLGPAGVMGSERVAAEAVGSAFGAQSGRLVALAVLVAIVSAANGITLTASRVYFAMARDGLFFRKFGAIHERFGTPAFAVAAGSLWSLMLAATGSFEQLLTSVVFAGWAFYGLGALAVFHYRWRCPERPRPFRVPGYPATPLGFAAAALGIVVSAFAAQPLRAALGVALVLAGVPAYWIWKRATPLPASDRTITGGDT